MKRLNAKQILVLPIGKYPDGNGLYLSIYKPGRGKWSFRYSLNKKANLALRYLSLIKGKDDITQKSFDNLFKDAIQLFY